jgi:hypothetical protein
MKKRKGTKRYKEQMFQCGSLEELREIVVQIFSGEAEGEYGT